MAGSLPISSDPAYPRESCAAYCPVATVAPAADDDAVVPLAFLPPHGTPRLVAPAGAKEEKGGALDGDASMSDITCLLNALEPGDQAAAAELLPLVYDDLR